MGTEQGAKGPGVRGQEFGTRDGDEDRGTRNRSRKRDNGPEPGTGMNDQATFQIIQTITCPPRKCKHPSHLKQQIPQLQHHAFAHTTPAAGTETTTTAAATAAPISTPAAIMQFALGSCHWPPRTVPLGRAAPNTDGAARLFPLPLRGTRGYHLRDHPTTNELVINSIPHTSSS